MNGSLSLLKTWFHTLNFMSKNNHLTRFVSETNKMPTRLKTPSPSGKKNAPWIMQRSVNNRARCARFILMSTINRGTVDKSRKSDRKAICLHVSRAKREISWFRGSRWCAPGFMVCQSKVRNRLMGRVLMRTMIVKVKQSLVTPV